MLSMVQHVLEVWNPYINLQYIKKESSVFKCIYTYYINRLFFEILRDINGLLEN